MCANLAHLEKDLTALEAAGCHELHFDIMDGLFVPNFTLGFDMITAARSCCGLACDAHLMITKPEQYVDRFVEAGCDSVSFHVEASNHPHRLLTRIRDAGASPGIAINPATPLTKLEYLLPLVDRILVMTVNPGYAGQPLVQSCFERVRILSENIKHLNLKAKIQVDGGLDVRNTALLSNFGAEIIVLGTSSIFKGGDVSEALKTFEKDVRAKRKVV